MENKKLSSLFKKQNKEKKKACKPLQVKDHLGAVVRKMPEQHSSFVMANSE